MNTPPEQDYILEKDSEILLHSKNYLHSYQLTIIKELSEVMMESRSNSGYLYHQCFLL